MSFDRAKLTADLKRDEGNIRHAYTDSLGYLTIGVGRLVDQRRGGGLSPAEIDYLLANDIDNKSKMLAIALPWFTGLDEVRQRALLNLAFQLGIGGLLNFKNTLAHLQAGRYREAATNALLSNWAAQTPSRARRIARMIETGKD